MSNGKIIGAGVVIVIAAFIGFGVWNNSQPGEYDAFAQCLSDKGAKFYGAFWCPHCQEQKAMFGRSAKKLPYRECSTPDQKSQVAECNDLGITGYPTWIFSDGERLNGVQSFETLAEKTQCELPS